MRPIHLALVAFALAAVAVPLGLDHATAQPAPAAAAAERPFPTITVEGTTELTIAPDEAWVHLGVTSFFTVLEKSVADNDRRITAVLSALEAQGIAAADIATQQMSLAETDRYESDQRRTHGWQVQRQLVARVRDLDKLEGLLQRVIGAGATNIDEVRFSHSQLTSKKADARVAAMKAARDKAEAMAGALGQKIGRAISIDEVSAFAGPIGQSTYGNTMMNAGGQVLDAATVVAGRIAVNVSVGVRFELL